MARHRSHSIAFKCQVAQEFVAGETLHGLAKRHDLSRNLIRLWVQKYEAGAFDEDATAADMIQEYEGRIAAFERLVGKQALELVFIAKRTAAEKRVYIRDCRPRGMSIAEGPILPNLARDMMPDGPNQLWVADITYVALVGAFVSVAVILDAWSRAVVGYAISRAIDARLTIAALKAAIERRRPPVACVHHSDRGSQYASQGRRLDDDVRRRVVAGVVVGEKV